MVIPEMIRKIIIAMIVAAAFGAIQTGAAAQQAGGFVVEVPEVRNFAGGALAIVPDYLGSDDYTVGIAPVLKIHFGRNERYFLRLLATELSLNVANSKSWSFGPMLNYRIGRDDVDDAVVDLMRDIDGAVEAGAFVGWSWVGGGDPRQRFNASLQFLNDVSGEHEGYVLSAAVRYFQPVSRPVTLTLGVSTSYGSEDYMATYFDVSPSDAARSGLPVFSADAGMRNVRISPGLIFSFSRKWHAFGGVIFDRLLSDASDSPIVSQRGDENQFLAGAGVLYAW